MSDDMMSLARDLEGAAADAGPFLRKAIEVTGRNVRDDWRSKVVGSPTIPHGATSITYDVEATGEGLTADIGPQKGRRQGFYVAVAETGAPRTPPKYYGIAALNENEADFEHGIEVAIDDALKGRNL